MEISKLCTVFRERVVGDLRLASSAAERGEILINSFYELSKKVLPALGYPSRSQHYLRAQAEVLDLVSHLAVLLLKEAPPEGRAVEVLIEVAEGCTDPLLRKKLTVYAHELLARRSAPGAGVARARTHRRGLLIGAGAVAATVLCIRLTQHPTVSGHPPPVRPESGEATPPPSDAAPKASFGPVRGSPAEERSEVSEPVAGESTKIRVVDNQVLVPVILRNGDEAIALELVLDTGASRTALHEDVAEQLHLDLRSARVCRTEVADGRIINSRLAKIDALSVGPFSLTSVELQFIPYFGSEGVHDGLLGMDFLGRHRYQLDLEKGVIHWL